MNNNLNIELKEHDFNMPEQDEKTGMWSVFTTVEDIEIFVEAQSVEDCIEQCQAEREFYEDVLSSGTIKLVGLES